MVSLAEHNPELIEEWDYDKNKDLGVSPETVSYGSNKDVWWICSKGHGWNAPIARRSTQNRGCPYCTNQKVLKGYNDLASKYPKLLKEWNYDKNDIKPDEILYGSARKVWWKCKDCGYEWETSVLYRTGRRKTNCPKCAPKLNREKQLANQISNEGSFGDNYPELLEEWDFEKNVSVDPYKIVAGSSEKVWWKCKKYGHEWDAVVVSRTRMGTGCPTCAGKIVEEGFNDLKSQQPVLMEEWDYAKNNAKGLYPNKVVCHSEKKAWWICSFCGNSYEAAICKRVDGTNCPECASELKTSFCEQAIHYYLSKALAFEGIDEPINRWNLTGYEVDIFLGCFNLGIEYDGELYHSDKKALLREKEKYEGLKEQGISLIRIKENFKNEKLTSYADYTIEVNKHNYDKEIPRIVKEIFSYINRIWGIDLGVDINIQEDRQNIYVQYIKYRRDNSVAVLYPDRIKDWDYEKNKIKPDCVTPGSSKLIWWKCPKNHSYEQLISNHVKQGAGCPYCANQKVLKGFNDLETKFPDIAKEWDFKRNILKPDQVLAFSNKKHYWLCSNNHSYEVSPYARCGKRHAGCPYCSGHKVLQGFNDLKTLRPDLAQEWDYEENKNGPEEYTVGCSSYKAHWICKKGHKWEATISSRNRGNGCPACAGRKVIEGENDFESQRPDLLKEWDFKKNKVKPNKIYVYSQKSYWWKCSSCGKEWKTSLFSRCKNNSGCKACSSIVGGQKHIDDLISKKGSLKDNYPELMKEWDYDKNTIDPAKITAGSHKKASWKCSKCGYKWSTEIRGRTLEKWGCPVCKKKIHQKLFGGQVTIF